MYVEPFEDKLLFKMKSSGMEIVRSLVQMRPTFDTRSLKCLPQYHREPIVKV